MSGSWTLDVETDLGVGTAKFVFQEADGKLTGGYEGMFGHLLVTGTIKRNDVSFSFIVDAAGQEETIAYSGTVDNDLMTGKVQLGGQGSGTFEGKRQ